MKRSLIWRLVERWLVRRVPSRALDAVLGDLEDDYAERRQTTGRMRGALWLWREARSVAAAYRTSGSHHGVPWRVSLEAIRADVSQSVRVLVRSPGSLAAVVFGLGAGLAASIGMLSILNAMFHGEPAGVRDRSSLASIRSVVERDQGRFRSFESQFSLEHLGLLHDHGPGVLTVGAFGGETLTVASADDIRTLAGAFVSGNYFDVLGTDPAEGRLLTQADDRPGGGVVVISYRLWHEWFDRDAAAVGSTLRVDNRTVRVVGVAPEGFVGGDPRPMSVSPGPQVWLPLGDRGSWPKPPAPADRWLSVVARLQRGLDRDDAAGEFVRAARAMGLLPDVNGVVRVRVLDPVLGDANLDVLTVTAVTAVVLAGPLLLLAIGCANVANLRLAHATARTHELAVRLALGARPWHLLRRLGIESLLLTMAAVFVGLLGAREVVRLVSPVVFSMPVALDWRVALFACSLALLVMVASGLAPAWLVTRRAMAHATRQTPQAGGAGHSRLRRALVVVQVGLSVVLLMIGSLLVRSVHLASLSVPRGYEGLLLADVDSSRAGYEAQRSSELAARVSARLRLDPRVEGVGVSAYPAVSGTLLTVRAPGTDRSTFVRSNLVAAGWLETMQLTPVAGRTIGPADRSDVVVLNEAAARLLSPDRSSLGETFFLVVSRVVVGGRVSFLELPQGEASVEAVTVIGIVPDSVPVIDRLQEAEPFLYRPLGDVVPPAFSLAVRSAHPGELMPDLRQAVMAADPALAPPRMSTAVERLAAGRGRQALRQVAVAVNALAAVAISLAALGLFAVLAYSVSLRRREIGIRLVLGASPADVGRLVIRQALGLTAAGLGGGLLVALPLAIVIRSVFLGVSPVDPLALGPAATLLVVVAIAAAIVPAWRAAAVEPSVTLRAD